MTKTFIWIGIFAGSTLGGFIPMMWGDDLLSVSSMIFSVLGAAAGLYGGWKLSQAV